MFAANVRIATSVSTSAASASAIAFRGLKEGYVSADGDGDRRAGADRGQRIQQAALFFADRALGRFADDRRPGELVEEMQPERHTFALEQHWPEQP